MERYKRTENNLSSKIDDELVMVNINQGAYYTMNAVATRIWELLVEDRSVDELVELLTNEYAIDRATCTEEVNAFLQTLIKNGIVERRHDQNPSK